MRFKKIDNRTSVCLDFPLGSWISPEENETRISGQGSRFHELRVHPLRQNTPSNFGGYIVIKKMPVKIHHTITVLLDFG
jgi:hypothetical protein